ncbi:hypothetical protein PHLGIDRAFT_11396 [Phlebiopsis gigantea 11061_1 CR5-6]|uniref:F-box domain-containing protein n=1 Tax=Phlebiopsis gigantea (strain 11061_1 CR5-6) TaxID=745531 RepID=A0A0C3NY35_PHLG1|nr:hypothetical protein PHLGIDRAFT_11396 [Phlebiopsis gigantea 11061_1 CR5-6]
MYLAIGALPVVCGGCCTKNQYIEGTLKVDAAPGDRAVAWWRGDCRIFRLDSPTVSAVDPFLVITRRMMLKAGPQNKLGSLLPSRDPRLMSAIGPSAVRGKPSSPHRTLSPSTLIADTPELTLKPDYKVFNSSLGNDEDDLLAAYDEELAMIERLSRILALASRRVRKARNSHVWIFELPLELLQTVFLMAGDGGADYKTMLSISWTCSHWRSASIYDPLLWGHIPLSCNSNIRTLFLERSQPATLTISSRGWHSLLRDEAICNRVSSLNLQFQLSSDFLGDRSSYNLPCLTDLEIELRGLYPGQEMACGILATSKFEFLPNLRSLTLNYGRFPWNSSIYANLTHLSVRFGSVARLRSYNENEEEEDIVDILRASPNLRSLELHLWSPLSSRWGQSPKPIERMGEAYRNKIRMPKLTSVILGVPLSYAVYILESIRVSINQITYAEITFYDRESDAMLEALFSDTCIRSSMFYNMHEMTICDGEPCLTGLRGVGRNDDGQEYTLRVVQSRLVARDCFHTILRDLRHVIPPTPSLRHVVLQIPEVESTIYKRNKTTFLQMTSFLRRCLPTISRLTLVGFHPTLFEVLAERAIRVSRDTPVSRLTSLEVDGRAKLAGVTPKLSELAGLAPLCRVLTECGAPLQQLALLGTLDAASKVEADEFIAEVGPFGVPAADWSGAQFRWVQDRARVTYEEVGGEWVAERWARRPEMPSPSFLGAVLSGAVEVDTGAGHATGGAVGDDGLLGTSCAWTR